VIFLGDLGAGKTAIFNRYVYNEYQEPEYEPVVGVPFPNVSVQLEDRTVTLQFWDTAGQVGSLRT
ncbi:small GTPase superfamily protein, partial [Kipferlia bialata]